MKSYNNILRTTVFGEGDKSFYYAAYVSSNFLDAHVNTERTDFNIPDNIADHELYGDFISLNKIRDKAIEQAKNYLSEYIEKIKAQNLKKCEIFVYKNPMLKHVLTHCPEIVDEIDENDTDEKINEVFYKKKGHAEYEIQQTAKELIKTQANSFQEIEQKHNELTKKLGDFNVDHLAGYLIWRKLIIQLLDSKLLRAKALSVYGCLGFL